MIMSKINGDDDLRRVWRSGHPVGKIKAWRLVDEMAVEAFQLTNAFPENVLCRQIREMAACCGSCVAESTYYQGRIEHLDGLRRSQALMMQLRYLIYLARRLLLIDQKKYARAIKKYEIASRALQELVDLSEKRKEK
jgi:hypothetical protein